MRESGAAAGCREVRTQSDNGVYGLRLSGTCQLSDLGACI